MKKKFDMLTYFDTWKCRCSYLSRIAVDLTDRITPKQIQTIAEYELREQGTGKALTENQKIELDRLRKKRDNTDLPKGVKTFLREEWLRIVHDHDTDIESKVLEKGNTQEEVAIDLLCDVVGYFMKKNTEEIQNDWIIGTPDLFTGRHIRDADVVDDTKCSWDIKTFYAAKDKADDGDKKEVYEWQIRGYCDLTGAKKGYIRRCLVDTPLNLIEADKSRLKWKLGVIDMDGPDKASEAYREGAAAIERMGAYNKMPKKPRVHSVEIIADKSMMEAMYDRIADCRKYLNQIHQEYLLELNEAEIAQLYLKLSA